MRSKYIFHNDHYYHTIKSQAGHGIPVFHGAHQRGEGLGDVLGGIARYALPLISKYIFPHAASTLASTISDVTNNGYSVKQALKKNSLNLVKNVAGTVVENIQKGKGIRRKKQKTKPRKVPKQGKKQSVKSKQNPRKKRVRSKLDIFG